MFENGNLNPPSPFNAPKTDGLRNAYTSYKLVFVERWGNLWWVGELNSKGMVTGVAKTEAEAQSLKPSNQELWTKLIRFARKPSIFVSDGNRKEIKSNGDFWVNGNKLGSGRWVSPSRYVVFVEGWGNRWWIGDFVSKGVLTTTVQSPTKIASATTSNDEPYAFPGDEGIWCNNAVSGDL